MMRRRGNSGAWGLGASIATLAVVTAAGASAGEVRTDSGIVEGVAGAVPHVQIYRGIPYAAPPVGDLRWREPQPVTPWTGVRKATEFGNRCMQVHVWDDMIFRDEMSEDCLNLNVWTPAASPNAKLPVMVWIYGGGFVAGSTSEARQDGERLAGKGVVVVSMNYRLGVFGFLAHPELTKESPHHASGNYGLLDQVAALRWVKKNIAAFGGDPENVTIFGESAGSFSVSALMASPVSRGLFHRAIGESGAFFTVGDQTLAPKGLAASEEAGRQFATTAGADSLAALRKKTADEVLKAATGNGPMRFGPNIDGYLLPEDAHEIFAAGKQSHVSLLAGWNADEIRAAVTLAPVKPTVKTFTEQVGAQFGDSAGAVLKAYPASTDAEALESAASLASDMFIGYATWKWIEMQNETGGSPVYRYSFDRRIPVPPDNKVDGKPATSDDIGARHAGEIEYVFGALDSLPKVPWQPLDRTISDQMMSYWTNFARSGDPNGPGLAKWPVYGATGAYQVLHFDDPTHAAPDARRPRYEALDAFTAKLRNKK
jgi:para-nitrobenzyl esterase